MAMEVSSQAFFHGSTLMMPSGAWLVKDISSDLPSTESPIKEKSARTLICKIAFGWVIRFPLSYRIIVSFLKKQRRELFTQCNILLCGCSRHSSYAGRHGYPWKSEMTCLCHLSMGIHKSTFEEEVCD